MQTSKALLVANSKLSMNAHLVVICPKNGSRRYVLFFKITNEIKHNDNVSNLWCCLKGLKHKIECNHCATGDELHAQTFALPKCKIVWNTIWFPINLLQYYASWSRSVVLHLLFSYDNSCIWHKSMHVRSVLDLYSLCISDYVLGSNFFWWKQILSRMWSFHKPLRFSTRTSMISNSIWCVHGTWPQHSCWSIHSAESCCCTHLGIHSAAIIL